MVGIAWIPVLTSVSSSAHRRGGDLDRKLSLGLDLDWSRSTGVPILPGEVVLIGIVVRSRCRVLARIRTSMRVEIGVVTGLDAATIGGVCLRVHCHIHRSRFLSRCRPLL